MNKNIKVLFIMHMPPPVHGASMVGKYIHDSETVNSEFECAYLNPTTAKNLDDVNKFRLGKVFDVFGLIKRIRERVREVKPDLVYFTANAAGMPFYKDFLIIRALKQEGCKVVVHYHNKGVATRQNRFVDNLLYKRFFKGIKVIQLSEYLYSDIEKYVKKENVCFCPNGIPQINFAKYVKGLEYLGDSLVQSGKPLNILYLSNMMEEKGVWTLVDACRLLHDKGIAFECHFVGGWKDVTEATFRNCITAYRLQDCVFAYGPKYEDEKEKYWQNADVFVFPTFYRNECFPLVLLEAMQHGVACVSTYEAAIPSIIDNERTGILFHANDYTGLADILIQLSKDRHSVKEMGETGQEKFNKEYTLEVFEKKFVECINWALH